MATSSKNILTVENFVNLPVEEFSKYQIVNNRAMQYDLASLPEQDVINLDINKIIVLNEQTKFCLARKIDIITLSIRCGRLDIASYLIKKNNLNIYEPYMYGDTLFNRHAFEKFYDHGWEIAHTSISIGEPKLSLGIKYVKNAIKFLEMCGICLECFRVYYFSNETKTATLPDHDCDNSWKRGIDDDMFDEDEFVLENKHEYLISLYFDKNFAHYFEGE